jgi:subtilase family serine protease
MSSPTLARRLRHAGLTLVRTDVTPRHGIQPQAAPAGLGPADLQSAYALPSSSAGSGQTVAIVDAYDDPNAESDLATYRSQYGLPPCTSASGCFKKVDQTGGSSLPTADAGWAEEESLDLDMVSAVCPSCHILLVEASQPSMSDLGTAVNTAISLGAKYVSNSYGGSEDSTDPGSDSSYFNHPGVAITVSSGDSGYGAEYPAASQYVTAVGGTSASAPIIAGTYALAGPPASGTYAASSPYAHSSALYDITSGNNGSCSPAYLCTAGAGHDGPTGLGTQPATIPAGRKASPSLWLHIDASES